jgi:hypothetical protein
MCLVSHTPRLGGCSVQASSCNKSVRPLIWWEKGGTGGERDRGRRFNIYFIERGASKWEDCNGTPIHEKPPASVARSVHRRPLVYGH